jgi:hypothetical protein
MADLGDSVEWDFLTLVAWWNLCGLPLVLTGFALIAVARSWWTGRLTPAVDGARAVTYIGCIHFALALRGLMQLVQELLTLRVMGIPQSFPVVGLFAPALAVLVDPLVGLGFWRHRPAARRWAIGWYVFWSSIALYVSYWMWQNSVRIDPATWPDQVVSKVLALYLLAIMFVPRVRRVFMAKRVPHGEREDAGQDPTNSSSGWAWPVVSLPTLLCLIIVLSTVLVDAADWAVRLATEASAP